MENILVILGIIIVGYYLSKRSDKTLVGKNSPSEYSLNKDIAKEVPGDLARGIRSGIKGSPQAFKEAKKGSKIVISKAIEVGTRFRSAVKELPNVMGLVQAESMLDTASKEIKSRYSRTATFEFLSSTIPYDNNDNIESNYFPMPMGLSLNTINVEPFKLSNETHTGCNSGIEVTYVNNRYELISDHSQKPNLSLITRVITEDIVKFKEICPECKSIHYDFWNRQEKLLISSEIRKYKQIDSVENNTPKKQKYIGLLDDEPKASQLLEIKYGIKPTSCTYCNGKEILKVSYGGIGMGEILTDRNGEKYINEGDLLDENWRHWECTNCKAGYRVISKNSFF